MEIKAEIIVERLPSEKDWMLSEFSILGVKRGVGVEDEKRNIKIKGETAIDNGIYEIDFTYSNRFSKEYFVDANGYLSKVKDKRFTSEHLVLLVKGVPNFDGIRWHWGCTDLDTLGCYCVGSYFGNVKTVKDTRKGVVSSRIKYIEVYPILFSLWRNNKENGLKTYVEYKDKK